MLAILGLIATLAPQSDVALNLGESLPAPPSLGISPHSPAWRTVETIYACDGEEVEFTARFDQNGGIRLVSARRGRRALSRSERETVTLALRRLQQVSTIEPQCSGTVHVLTARGMADGEAAEVLIIWTPHAATTSAPMPVQSESSD